MVRTTRLMSGAFWGRSILIGVDASACPTSWRTGRAPLLHCFARRLPNDEPQQELAEEKADDGEDAAVGEGRVRRQ